LKKIILLSLLILAFAETLAAQASPVSYYSPENILRFADFLFEEKEYARAAAEYQRYLILGDFRQRPADTIYHKIGKAYQLAQDYQRSSHVFQMIVDGFVQSSWNEDAHWQIALNHFFLGQYDQSVSYAETCLPRVSSTDIQRKTRQLIGVNYMYHRKWKDADLYFRTLIRQGASDPATGAFQTFAAQGLQLPQKMKWLAGLMSAIIPGTGKIYSGRTTDGLLSLITIAATGWQAYEGFHRDGTHSVRGWIFGSMCAYFYLGDIYGSIAAIQIFNSQNENKLLNQIGISLRVFFQ